MSPEKTRVLVIGAGVSGLTAARQVKQELPDVEVIVLEARQRFGGRVWTETFEDGTAIDLGAHFIHGVCDDHPIGQIAKEHPEWGELVEMDWESCPDFELGSDREISEELLRRCEELYEETWDLYESRCKERSDDPETEDISLWERLQQDFDWSQLSDSERLLLRWRWARETEWIYAAPMEELSSRWWNDDGEFEGPDCMWPGGFANFTKWLAEGLDLRLGFCATRVVSSENNVAVHGGHGDISGDLVIVTLPLGVLKSGKVEFVPPLSDTKEAAIQAVGMALLNKVALRFREPFWPSESCGFNRVALAPREVDGLEPHEWVFQPPCAGAPVAVAFFHGNMARKMEALSQEDVTQQLLRILAETFGRNLADLQASLLEVKRSQWQEEFSGGSYSYLPCGVAPRHRAALAAPHGNRVFFAGEHCRNDYPSTLHGAHLSGLKAAQDVLEFLKSGRSASGGYR